MKPRAARAVRSRAVLLTGAVVLAACSDGAGNSMATDVPASGIESNPVVETGRVLPAQDGRLAPTGQVIVDATFAIPFDRRLLGTNVPAWIGPERLADEAFRSETRASGTTLLRMPGGSWSNAYDWLGCELGDDSRCFWTWAARPTDFVDFLQATELDGMWTVSINETAQAAAAAVAFFNATTDDDTVIGVDRDGTDWKTAGTWAQLRADGGNPDPIGIELWEVGNEVYGGSAAGGGSECADFGWEDVWTCDGAEYVAGIDGHDGYLDIRSAMLAVDPSIEVGAVGVAGPGEWSNWGNEVIDGAGSDLDFYVVHSYGFDASPSPREALRRPGTLWAEILTPVADALGSDIPIAVTEYNLVSFEQGDSTQSMTRSLNALFIADSIGQIALTGASIANQWNLANGVTSSGTDYGLINLDDGSRRPQFAALQAWSTVGTKMFSALVADEDLRVYPTQHDDGNWTVLAINLGDDVSPVSVTIPDVEFGPTIEVSIVAAADLSSMTLDERTLRLDLDPDSTDTTPVIDIPAHSIVTIHTRAPSSTEADDDA